MPFSEFWKRVMTQQELQAISILEQQISALDKEWLMFDKETFTDWNVKFKGLTLKTIRPEMQIPLRDARVEKKEFKDIWTTTIELFHRVIKLIRKGKTQRAISHLFETISALESMIDKLERDERGTVTYLRKNIHIFQTLFDNNYGKGYFHDEVLRNYEVRFRILEILRYEYELVRYFLSETI